MNKAITKYQDGSTVTHSIGDAYYAANDPDWKSTTIILDKCHTCHGLGTQPDMCGGRIPCHTCGGRRKPNEV